jgi:HAD superfamily hydrolase (TIGR01509 family)
MLTIFDCDGVLIDSEILASGVYAEMMRELGLSISHEEAINRFTGLTHAQLEVLIHRELGRPLPADFRQRSTLEIDRRLESVKPIAGVHAMLDRLQGPRCVCSNSSTARLKISMGATGLWERFQPHIFSAPELGRSKPAPDVFLHAARVFGVDPRDALVIEDSSHGVEGAIAAGMRVIGFTGGGHTWPGHAQALLEAGAVKVVSRLEEVGAAIEVLAA